MARRLETIYSDDPYLTSRAHAVQRITTASIKDSPAISQKGKTHSWFSHSCTEDISVRFRRTVHVQKRVETWDYKHNDTTTVVDYNTHLTSWRR